MAKQLDYQCRCGRYYVTKNASPLCPTCITEAITGKPITEASEEDKAEGRRIFHNDLQRIQEIWKTLN